MKILRKIFHKQFEGFERQINDVTCPPLKEVGASCSIVRMHEVSTG